MGKKTDGPTAAGATSSEDVTAEWQINPVCYWLLPPCCLGPLASILISRGVPDKDRDVEDWADATSPKSFLGGDSSLGSMQAAVKQMEGDLKTLMEDKERLEAALLEEQGEHSRTRQELSKARAELEATKKRLAWLTSAAEIVRGELAAVVALVETLGGRSGEEADLREAAEGLEALGRELMVAQPDLGGGEGRGLRETITVAAAVRRQLKAFKAEYDLLAAAVRHTSGALDDLVPAVSVAWEQLGILLSQKEALEKQVAAGADSKAAARETSEAEQHRVRLMSLQLQATKLEAERVQQLCTRMEADHEALKAVNRELREAKEEAEHQLAAAVARLETFNIQEAVKRLDSVAGRLEKSSEATMESASAQNEASAAVRLQLSVMAGGVNERRLIEAQLEERRKMAGEKVAEATIKLQALESQLEAARAEVAAREASSSEAKGTSAAASAQAGELQFTAVSLRAKVEEACGHRDESAAALAEAVAAVSACAFEMEEALKQMEEDMQVEHTATLKSADETLAELGKAKGGLAEARRQLETSARRIKDLEAKAQELKESEASLAKQLNEAETRQLQAEGQARTAEERLTEESAALSVAEEMKRRAEEAAWNSIAEARRREGDVAAKASALAARLRASRGRSGEEGEVTLSNVDPAGAAGEGLEAAAAAAEALLEETEKERRAWLASSKAMDASMAELSASMEKSQAEADMFRAKAAQAEAQELALATKIRALEEEIEVAGKEIAEVEAEASAALRVGGEERSLAAVGRESSTQGKVSALAGLVASMGAKLHELREEREQLEAAKAKVEASLAEKESKESAASAKLSQAEEELAALRLSLDSAEATVSGLLGSLEAYGEALGAANSGSAAVAEQQERTMEALRTRLAEAAGAAEAARAEMEEVAAEAARAKEERDEASVALEKAAEVLMEGEKAVGSLGPEITEALAAHQAAVRQMLSTRADFVAVREQLATLGQRSLLVEAKREEMAAERDEARRLLQVEEAKGQKASSELRGLRDQLESAAIREKALIEEMAKLEAEKARLKTEAKSREASQASAAMEVLMAERQLRSISRQGSEAGGDDDERLAALPAEVALCESLKRLQERLAEERRIRGTQANDRVSTQSQLNQISQQKEALRAEAQALMASLVEARAERADLSAREAEARRRATEFEERLRAMEAAKAALEADLKFEREATAAAASATVVANAVGNSRRQEEKEQLAEAVVQLQGEREALERSLAAERRSAKASAASKAAMEIEMANNEARLRRSAEDLSRLRAEAEAAQAEVAQLRAEKDMLAGAKRGLEEVTAREKADLMKALADLEELSARLVAAQEAAEVSEGARRRLEEELRDGKAVGRRAAEQVRSVASERNALAAVHADIGTDLLAVLQMLQGIEAEMQELVNLRNSTLSGSPLSPEAVGDRALRASQEAVQRAETGMEEATVLLRAAQEAAEMTDGSQGLAEVGGGLSSAQRSARAELQAAVATLRRLSHSLSGVSAIMTNDIGISEDMEEDEAEERADAVAQVRASFLAAASLVGSVEAKLVAVADQSRASFWLQGANESLTSRLAAAEEALGALQADAAAAAKSLAEEQRRRADAEEQLRKIGEEVASGAAEQSRLAEALERSSSALSELEGGEERLEVLRRDLARVTAMAAAAEAGRAEAAKDLEEAEDQLGELLDQLQGVAAANAALQKELSAAAKTSDAVEALERRCGALEQANASLLEGQALLREMLEEALAAGQKRAAGELEEANDLRLDLVGARDTLKLLLGTMEAASRHHRELEQNNADIYNSVEGLVDVVDDLKRMNDELRNENDTLSADKERLEMLEERCESLEAQLRMVGGVSQERDAVASWRRASMMDDLEEPEAEALRMYDNVACGQGDTRTISMSMDEEVVWNQGTASEQQGAYPSRTLPVREMSNKDGGQTPMKLLDSGTSHVPTSPSPYQVYNNPEKDRLPSDDGSSPYLASTSLKRMSEDTGRDSQPRNSSQLARVIEEETSATPVAQQQYLTANNRSWHSRHSIDLGVMSGAASFHGVETAGDAQSLQDEGSKGKRKMKGMLKSMLKGLKGFQTGTGSKGQRQSS